MRRPVVAVCGAKPLILDIEVDADIDDQGQYLLARVSCDDGQAPLGPGDLGEVYAGGIGADNFPVVAYIAG